jgi:hypothetical protein
VGVIEYGYVAPDPLHPETIYGAGRTEVSKFDSVTGQVQNITPLPLRTPEYRADRTEPIFFLPLDQSIMVYATNVLWERATSASRGENQSRPGAGTHRSTCLCLFSEGAGRSAWAIYSVAASFKNADILWAGTDDGQWITRTTARTRKHPRRGWPVEQVYTDQ